MKFRIFSHLFVLLNRLTLFSLVLVITHCTPSPESVDQYLSKLPSDLELTEKIPQKYLLTVDYSTHDMYGQLLSKMQVTAGYTRALPEGKVRWNNVRIARAENPADSLTQGELQEYMGNFTYNPYGNLLDEDFFKDFPATIMETKVLIWDMVSIEVWAWNYFDKLDLNEVYRPAKDGETFQMAGSGTFQNKDLRLTWVGLSKMNNEITALIQYESLFNPLDMSWGSFSMRGRTNYWGNIWVSLEDKQIEYALLREDGLLEIQAGENAEKSINNLVHPENA